MTTTDEDKKQGQEQQRQTQEKSPAMLEELQEKFKDLIQLVKSPDVTEVAVFVSLSVLTTTALLAAGLGGQDASAKYRD